MTALLQSTNNAMTWLPVLASNFTIYLIDNLIINYLIISSKKKTLSDNFQEIFCQICR